MKNITVRFVVVLATVCFPLVAGAQDLPPATIDIPDESHAPVEVPRSAVVYHNELSVGYGAWSSYDLVLATFKIITPVLTWP